MSCPFKCKASIIHSNSATNFKNPVYSVKRCIEKKILIPNIDILEFGSGNLRNSLFIINSVPDITIYAYDFLTTYQRFREKYDEFCRLGGKIVSIDTNQTFDRIICTYVLETFCPPNERNELLKILGSKLSEKGLLIASFRGYKGIVGSKYQLCPIGDGYLSPLKTFVKPYSIPEVSSFLNENGFNQIELLKNYRVEKPQNIHLVAGEWNKSG